MEDFQPIIEMLAKLSITLHNIEQRLTNIENAMYENGLMDNPNYQGGDWMSPPYDAATCTGMYDHD